MPGPEDRRISGVDIFGAPSGQSVDRVAPTEPEGSSNGELRRAVNRVNRLMFVQREIPGQRFPTTEISISPREEWGKAAAEFEGTKYEARIGVLGEALVRAQTAKDYYYALPDPIDPIYRASERLEDYEAKQRGRGRLEWHPKHPHARELAAHLVVGQAVSEGGIASMEHKPFQELLEKFAIAVNGLGPTGRGKTEQQRATQYARTITEGVLSGKLELALLPTPEQVQPETEPEQPNGK